jgi:hypothetical protein
MALVSVDVNAPMATRVAAMLVLELAANVDAPMA